ncbi:DEAD/DEAH box helicase [Tenacibaculum sp. A30]|uniref:DEAD/DEAH box helicase n=1 Tax=Tenacibaculum sp. A30 TaxID=3442644 RepID=UPI003EBEA72E
MEKKIIDLEDVKIISRLHIIELYSTAIKLGLINKNKYSKITYPLLLKSISLLDRLSRFDNNQETKNLVITLCGILWQYRNPKWDLLHESLILFLSRIGYAPSGILIDKEYDFNEKKHSSFTSYINQLYISMYNENYEIEVLDKKFLLTEFQKKVWDEIDKNRVVGISAPTSAGKSYLILLKTIEILLRKEGNVLYVVPTLSLISQVSNDFNQMLKDFGLYNYSVFNTYSSDKAQDNNQIYVLTQERAISAFSQEKNPFENIQVFIIDEIQNIERVDSPKDTRAKTLFDLLNEYRHNSSANKIIISGPRIEDIGDLGENLFGVESMEINVKSSPVVNFTYSIAKQGKAFLFKQYSDFFNNPISLRITNKEIVGYGGSMYNEKFNDFLYEIISKLGSDSKNIVFAPNPKQARNIAIGINKERDDIEQLDEKIILLSEYLSDSVSDNYSLINVVKNNIAYHHGKLPHHVRFVIEKAIKEKLIGNVVCTTTLMQGVNLPTQNVFIRNPNLFVQRKKNSNNPTLTKYEIANLSGRAGRLLKDFIGRTYILDEDSFKEDSHNQASLFDKPNKKLNITYANRFNSNRDEIINSLTKNTFGEAEEDKFISCYIRQTILKYQDDSITKLESTGIKITNEELVEIKSNLNELNVPVEVCLKNRYWDPFDLDKLYSELNKIDIPSSINDGEAANKLFRTLLYLYNNYHRYYDRYVKIKLDNPNTQRLLFSICITAIKWSKEVPLKQLIYDHDEDKIEDLISNIQNKISYGIPVLLKPIYDMVNEEHSFLTFMEMGAYKPITRKLIEYNIPRETSVFLSNNYLNSDNFESKEEIIDRISSIYDELNYWIQVQIEHIL